MMRVVALVLLLAGVVLGSGHHEHKHALKVPVFPTDWTSIEQDFAVVYQGQYVQTGGMYCCGDANCEIQTEYQSGHNYFDFTNQRTRFDDPVQGSIVSLFKPVYKEMAVDANNVCQAFCPIEDDLEPYGIPVNATDQGPTIVNNKTVEDWQSKVVILGVIVMEIDDFYVDQSKSPAIPIQEIDQLTPFGEKIGEFTSNYLSFVPGTPDPSHFDIKGVDNCPMSQNCDEQRRQMHRLRYKNRLTWLKSHQNLKMKKGK
jgi:hypothetical protein